MTECVIGASNYYGVQTIGRHDHWATDYWEKDDSTKDHWATKKDFWVKIGKTVRRKTIGRQNDNLSKTIGRKTFGRKIIGREKKTLSRKLKYRCKKDHWATKYVLLKEIGRRTFRRKTIGRQRRVT